MTDLTQCTDEHLWNQVEICKTVNKRLVGKKSRIARTEASQNAERFTEITRELKRRGLC